jgi:hypothetical protein
MTTTQKPEGATCTCGVGEPFYSHLHEATCAFSGAWNQPPAKTRRDLLPSAGLFGFAAWLTTRLGLSEDEWCVLLDAIDKARVMLRQGIARSRAFADHDGVAAAEHHIEVLDAVEDKLRGRTSRDR